MDRFVGGIGIRRGAVRRPLCESATRSIFGASKRISRTIIAPARGDETARLCVAEFEALPRDDGGTILVQTAFFDPRGAFGLLYWYSVLAFHEFIFGNMAKRIVRDAETKSC